MSGLWSGRSVLLGQGVKAEGLAADLVGHRLCDRGGNEQADSHDDGQDLHAHGPTGGLEDRGDGKGEEQLGHRGAHEGEAPLGTVLSTHVPLAAGDGRGDPEHARADAGEDAVGEKVQREGVARALGDERGQEEAEEAADGADRVGRLRALLIDEPTGEVRRDGVEGHHEAVAERGLRGGPAHPLHEGTLHDRERGTVAKEAEDRKPCRDDGSCTVFLRGLL